MQFSLPAKSFIVKFTNLSTPVNESSLKHGSFHFGEGGEDTGYRETKTRGLKKQRSSAWALKMHVALCSEKLHLHENSGLT